MVHYPDKHNMDINNITVVTKKSNIARIAFKYPSKQNSSIGRLTAYSKTNITGPSLVLESKPVLNGLSRHLLVCSIQFQSK